MPEGCVKDVSSIEVPAVNATYALPLDRILSQPVCSSVSLQEQADLIGRAVAYESLEPQQFFACALVGYVVWAVIDLVVRRCMKGRWPAIGPPSATANIEVRQCIVSSVHSVWSVGAAIFLMTRIEQPFGVDRALAHIPHRYINAVGIAFFSYLLWDLTHILHHRGVHGKTLVEQVTHHLCFMAMMTANQKVLWFNWAFPVLYIGELSTFFLNVRLLYRKFEMPELWVSASFALIFFLTRVVAMGIIVVHLLGSHQAAREILNPVMQVSYLVGLPAMYSLNLFWFHKIVDGVRRTLRKTKSA